MLWMLAVVLTLLIDQASKRWIRESCSRRSTCAAYDRSVIRLVRNRRLAWGLAGNHRLRVALWMLCGAMLLVMTLACVPMQHPQAQIGAGLAFGGATGNLVDMKFQGAVTDFIDLRFWPVFNLADVAIVCGAAIVGLRFLGSL